MGFTKFSWYLEHVNKKTKAKEHCCYDLSIQIDENNQDLICTAFTLLKDHPQCSEIKSIFLPDEIMKEQKISEELHRLSLECVNTQVESDRQLNQIIKQVKNINLNYKSSIVWGIVIAVIGLVFCNHTFLYIGFIPMIAGVIKIVLAIRKKTKTEIEIQEIDEQIQKAEDYFYSVCKQKAYQINNYIAEHLNDFWMKGK